MILALLLGLCAHAAPPAEKWVYKVDGKPAAAFFDAAGAGVYVSVDEGAASRVDRLGLDGKLKQKGVARASGKAGPLRAHSGKVYWVAGDAVWSLAPGNGAERAAAVPAECGPVNDVAVSREGKILLGCASGRLLDPGREGALPPAGKPITGLFLLDTVLYVLRDGTLEPFDLAGKKSARARRLCRTECRGLERRPSGAWIVAGEGKVGEFGAGKSRVLLEAGEPVGRIAYIYGRDPREDMLVVPYLSSREVRAYELSRLPAQKAEVKRR